VKLRFLALAGIYRDWCSIAWQERANPGYSDWAYILEINAFHLGQLMRCDDTEFDQELDQDQLCTMALRHLISLSRPEVLAGLLRA
jgi:hypothetical protein